MNNLFFVISSERTSNVKPIRVEIYTSKIFAVSNFRVIILL